MMQVTTAGVLRGTKSALEIGGVNTIAAIPENTLVRPVMDRSGILILTGAQWGPGFKVELNWHSAPAQMKRGFEEVAEFDVTCESQVRVDALVGGDFLVLDAPGRDARLRLSADGRPRGLAAEAEDDDHAAVVERYCLDFWKREDEAPPVMRTLNKAELRAVLVAARAAAKEG